MFKDKLTSKNMFIAAVLVIIAILSFTVVTKYTTSAETHSESMAVLEEKKVTAMKLTAGVAVTSTAITALPGDAATPIAEQVADLTGPLLVVICAIYLEKFLLTTIGYVSFKLLIPAACLLGICYIFSEKGWLKAISVKIAMFATAIAIAIPASVGVTKLIETTFSESIKQTYESADEITGEAEKSTEKEEETNGFLQFLQGLGDGVSSLKENAENALSVFIDAIAVLIITTCVVPILVILFFLWIIKLLFGINIDMSHAKKLIPGKVLKG